MKENAGKMLQIPADAVVNGKLVFPGPHSWKLHGGFGGWTHGQWRCNRFLDGLDWSSFVGRECHSGHGKWHNWYPLVI